MVNVFPSGKVDWVKLDGRRKLPLFYAANGEIAQAFVQYSMVVAAAKEHASAQAFKTAIEDVGHHLGAFQTFLDHRRIAWTQANDEKLEKFRDWVLSRVLENPICRSELAARRTTNRYVRSVYRFLLWAQEEGRLIHAWLGWPDAPVRSLLARKRANPEDRFPGSSLYPLCFTKCGQGSRHTYQYVATRKDVDRLLAYFFENQTQAVAERNALIVAVIDHVGWRQGSVVSLSTLQFGDDAVAHARLHGYAWVVPAVQKFGYENAFPVPLALVYRAREYIQGSRQSILAACGESESRSQNQLFLNVLTAEPLSPNAVSQIFSRAFRKIGAPPGAGAHSLRRKFADEKIEVEIAVRKRENKTTDPVNVGAVLQRALGQSSIRSQEAYARAIGRATWDSVERRQQERIQALEHENATLRAAVRGASNSAARPTKA